MVQGSFLAAAVAAVLGLAWLLRGTRHATGRAAPAGLRAFSAGIRDAPSGLNVPVPHHGPRRLGELIAVR